jgi:hypothetical protein
VGPLYECIECVGNIVAGVVGFASRCRGLAVQRGRRDAAYWGQMHNKRRHEGCRRSASVRCGVQGRYAIAVAVGGPLKMVVGFA